MKKHIILASKSPRRRDLLVSLGLDFDIIVSDSDENIPSGTSPDTAVKILSERKAAAVFENNPDSVVIGSDTVVYLKEENIILGKPKNEDDAKKTLRMLSGRRHYVYTGVTVTSKHGVTSDCEITSVLFAELTDGEIEDYIATGECFDKAGSYGIQDLGGIFVKAIEGDYFNVTGMPKRLTYELLSHHGVDVLEYNKKDKNQ